MGKVGEKQKRRPKLKDKRQSERFKEAARKLGADQPSDAFDRIVQEMAKPQEAADHIAGAKTLIRKSNDEISDAKQHVDASLKAVRRSKRLLKKKAETHR